MAKQFLSPIGLPSGTSDPASAAEGDLFYRTDLGKIRLYKDSAWSNVEGSVDIVDGGAPSSTYDSLNVISQSYEPANPFDWDSTPTTIAGALNELASRLRALEP